MKVEELWDVLMLPAIDMDTKEPIDSRALDKIRDREVLNVSCDGRYNIEIRYDKEKPDGEDD